MKTKLKVLVAATVLWALAGQAWALNPLQLGSGFSVVVSSTVKDSYVAGAWDLINRKPLAGYGWELLHFGHKNPGEGWNDFGYLAGENLFDPAQGGRGRIGASLGYRMGTLSEHVATMGGKLASFVTVPKAVVTAGNWVTGEVGGGYNLSPMPGDKPWYWSVGGKVKLPLDQVWSFVSSITGK